MEGGKFDRWITLQRSTDTQDEFGAPVKVWNTLATLRAAYKPVSDGEKVAAGEVGATLSARFTIRWSTAWDDVLALDRLVFDGRTYDIWGVKEIGRREGFEITAATRAE